MGFGNAAKNLIPRRSPIASFLPTPCNDVLFFIFMQNNSTCLLKHKNSDLVTILYGRTKSKKKKDILGEHNGEY